MEIMRHTRFRSRVKITLSTLTAPFQPTLQSDLHLGTREGTRWWPRLGQRENSTGWCESGALLNSVLKPFTKGSNLQAVASRGCYNCQDKPSMQKRKLFHKVQWACVHSRWRDRQNGGGEWTWLVQLLSFEVLAWTAYPASLSTCFIKWGCPVGPACLVTALLSESRQHWWLQVPALSARNYFETALGTSGPGFFTKVKSHQSNRGLALVVTHTAPSGYPLSKMVLWAHA